MAEPLKTLKPEDRKIEYKTILERDGVKSALDTGNKAFESDTSVVSTDKQAPKQTQSETTFIGGKAICEFTKKDGTVFSTEYVNEIEIVESIDQLYRTGNIIIREPYGFVEASGVVNTLEGERITIKLKNDKEDGRTRDFDFAMTDMKTRPYERFASYNLYEEPFFTNLYKQNIVKSYQSESASDIILDIVADDLAAGKIKYIGNSADPKIPNFIVPFWNAEKTIKYLTRYSEQGPIKIFNITVDNQTITVIATLDQLMRGQLFTEILTIQPQLSQESDGTLQLNDWTIFGNDKSDAMNDLMGKSVINFSYFAGKKQDALMSYKEGTFEFDESREKNYLSTISGDYANGVTDKITPNDLGGQLLYEKASKSAVNHSIEYDVDEKPLTKAKLISDFRVCYHDQLVLYCLLPGSSYVNIGQIYNVVFPSQVQPHGDLPNEEDTNFGGKWLLWKIVHKYTPTGGRQKYEMHCYFYRTGYNIATPYKKVEEHG